MLVLQDLRPLVELDAYYSTVGEGNLQLVEGRLAFTFTLKRPGLTKRCVPGRWVDNPQANAPGFIGWHHGSGGAIDYLSRAARARRSEMEDPRVPNLEEMDEQQVRRFLTELLPKLSPEEEYELRHEDYVMEMPQSGERIRGREKMREFQEAYPNPPTMQLRRVIVREGLWVVEIISDYGGRIYRPVLIIELRDGKMFRDTRYYSEPFGAPEWRAQWVERMES